MQVRFGRWVASLGPQRPPEGIAFRQPTSEPPADIWGRYVAAAARVEPPTVLEVGTRANGSRSTHQKDAFPTVARGDYLMADIQPGPDVDVVADLHALPADWTGRFGAFVSLATFEHLERPWVAAREVARILAPGGIFMVCTHQTFPLHGYPKDFFRFSKEALSLIFTDAGLEVLDAAYQDRCSILPPPHLVPEHDLPVWHERFPAYVLVAVFGRKPGP